MNQRMSLWKSYMHFYLKNQMDVHPDNDRSHCCQGYLHAISLKAGKQVRSLMKMDVALVFTQTALGTDAASELTISQAQEGRRKEGRGRWVGLSVCTGTTWN